MKKEKERKGKKESKKKKKNWRKEEKWKGRLLLINYRILGWQCYHYLKIIHEARLKLSAG